VYSSLWDSEDDGKEQPENCGAEVQLQDCEDDCYSGEVPESGQAELGGQGEDPETVDNSVSS